MIELRCPESQQALYPATLGEAESLAGGVLLGRGGRPHDPTMPVLVRADRKAAYPVVSGIPILIAPAVLALEQPDHDLSDTRWSEAYAEMEFYNQSAAAALEHTLSDEAVQIRQLVSQPWPKGWVDAAYDAVAQADAIEYLGFPRGQAVLQLGGKGMHAMKSLLGGAAQAWLVTPMESEARYAVALAESLQVADRFRAVVGVAEQIPMDGDGFDSVYTGGCLHHMSLEYAAPELKRILKPGGRLAAVEPFQTSLHRLGTRLIGKREANAHCRPLTAERLEPITLAFAHPDIRHHGPVLRYLALAMQKFIRRSITPRTGLKLGAIDDSLPLPERYGGSVAVLAER